MNLIDLPPLTKRQHIRYLSQETPEARQWREELAKEIGVSAVGGGNLCERYVDFGVTPYKHLGKISDILHLNNKNNQLERWARPPRDVLLDAQLWTWASSLSSRVVAVTTTTYASWTLAQVPCIGFSIDFPSRSALEDGSGLRQVNAILAMSYYSHWRSYLKKSYDQIRAIIADG